MIKPTNTQSELQSLLESGQADAEVYWNASTRLEYFGGHTNIAQVVPQGAVSHQRLPVDPQGRAAPGAGPDLHQLAAVPRGAVPQQLAHRPRAVGRAAARACSGEAYESHIPDWFQADYYNYYLTLDQIKSSLQTLDWPAYNASAKVFQDYYAQALGQ